MHWLMHKFYKEARSQLKPEQVYAIFGEGFFQEPPVKITVIRPKEGLKGAGGLEFKKDVMQKWREIGQDHALEVLG